MSALREAANKMLKMLEEASLADPALAAEIIYKIGAALPSLRTALALEQADPCPNCASLEAQNTELDRKLAEMEQAEPLNLSDRAVQRRLATQWGYVPAQAEPTQEPVAWLQPKTVDAHSRPDLGYETCSKDDYGAFPVHTAPPRRTMVPLTEEEIFKAASEWLGYDDKVMNLARAIEKASWEKNHG